MRLRSTDPNVQVGGVNPTNVTITDDDGKCSSAVDRHKLTSAQNFAVPSVYYDFCTGQLHRLYCISTAVLVLLHSVGIIIQ